MTDALKMAREALAELGAAHAWLAFGECRAYDAVRSGPVLSSADADAKARAAIAAIDAQQAATVWAPLTEAQMYEVEEAARRDHRMAYSGPMGQMLSYWDGITPWLIRAVERHHGIGAAAQGGE